MSISRFHSTVTMPQAERPYPAILDFLSLRFPRIPHSTWGQRIIDGKVLDDAGSPISCTTEYAPFKRLFYFREVEQEPQIPFREQIIFQNEHLLVACKPHFLPVTPGGAYVAECLLNRLRKSSGNDHLAPLHRIDRETAGIVLFSTNPETRSLYSRLFLQGRVEKGYLALAADRGDLPGREWRIENRIVKGEPWFRMRTAPGEPNARSVLRLVDSSQGVARFQLNPLTGKTHQLRLHMSTIGYGIINDRYYPELQPESADNFEMPLQLLARTVRFRDPLSNRQMQFRSERQLLCQPSPNS